LDLLERDNIPVDVSVFTVENNEIKLYERGLDPVSPLHEVQAAPGNKTGLSRLLATLPAMNRWAILDCPAGTN
jgi:hypothetical protein